MATRARTAEPSVVERAPTRERSAVTAGLLAGLVAVIAMSIWFMGHAAVNGMGIWTPLKLIAATFVGIESLVGGPGVLLVGGLIHMVTGMAYGVIFAFLLPSRAGAGAGLLAGLVYGGLILLLMTFAVLPAVNDIMRERVDLIPVAWTVGHLIYGATLGLLLPAFRGRVS